MLRSFSPPTTPHLPNRGAATGQTQLESLGKCWILRLGAYLQTAWHIGNSPCSQTDEIFLLNMHESQDQSRPPIGRPGPPLHITATLMLVLSPLLLFSSTRLVCLICKICMMGACTLLSVFEINVDSSKRSSPKSICRSVALLSNQSFDCWRVMQDLLDWLWGLWLNPPCNPLLSSLKPLMVWLLINIWLRISAESYRLCGILYVCKHL